MGRTASALLVAALLGACGTPTATNSLSAPAARPQPSEEITLATDRGLSVIAQSGATVRELPHGVAAPDWSVFYAVEPGPTTLVRLLDPVTGAERRKLRGARPRVGRWRSCPSPSVQRATALVP